MAINAPQFRQLVIMPALVVLESTGIPITKTAADLLMATAANETNLGTWLNQEPGPALGVSIDKNLDVIQRGIKDPLAKVPDPMNRDFPCLNLR